MVNTKKFTDWLPTEEHFQFLTHCWDVKAAKLLLQKNPHKVETMDISEYKPLVGGIGIYVNKYLVESGEGINLDVPIIVGQLQTSALPIDGWHRIARALKLGINQLPCVYLTKKETESIKK